MLTKENRKILENQILESLEYVTNNTTNYEDTYKSYCIVLPQCSDEVIEQIHYDQQEAIAELNAKYSEV